MTAPSIESYGGDVGRTIAFLRIAGRTGAHLDSLERAVGTTRKRLLEIVEAIHAEVLHYRVRLHEHRLLGRPRLDYVPDVGLFQTLATASWFQQNMTVEAQKTYVLGL